MFVLHHDKYHNVPYINPEGHYWTYKPSLTDSSVAINIDNITCYYLGSFPINKTDLPDDYTYGTIISSYAFKWTQGDTCILIEDNRGLYKYDPHYDTIERIISRDLRKGNSWYYTADTEAIIKNTYEKVINGDVYCCVEVGISGLVGGDTYVWAMGLGLLSFTDTIFVDPHMNLMPIFCVDNNTRIIEVTYSLVEWGEDERKL